MAEKKATIVIKKINKGGHGHHGGAWKVAFADFMTALMAFFLVMWLMGADEETKAAIERYFNNPTSAWRKDMDAQETQILGDMTANGESLLKGSDGQVSESFVKEPSRVSRAQSAADEGQALEGVLGDNTMVELDTLRFLVPEDQIFQNGSLTDWTDKANGFLPKLGRLTRVYKGNLTIKWDFDNGTQGSDAAGSYEFQNNRAVALKQYLVDRDFADEPRIFIQVVPQRRPAAEPGVKPPKRMIEFVLSKSTASN